MTTVARKYLDSRRISGAEARQVLEDDLERGRRVPVVRAAPTASVDREARLLAQASRQNPESLSAVRRAVVDQILAQDFVSEQSDQRATKNLLAYAVWCFEHHGRFDPGTDLADHLLNARIKQVWPDAPESSRATRLSTLRWARRGPKPSLGWQRPPSAPYSEQEWSILQYAADSAADCKGDAHLLLALSGGAGLRPQEIVGAAADWVVTSRSTALIRVPRETGEYRLIPLDPRPGEVLNRAARDSGGGFLLRPSSADRRHVASRTIEAIRRRTALWNDFNVRRARNYWLCDLLSRPIPYTAICAMADVNQGNTLTANLLPFTSDLSDDAIIAAFKSGSHTERFPR